MTINYDNPRMRIVHIISGDRWAGAEVQAFSLMSELVKNHDVFAIVLNEGELAERLSATGVNVKVFDETKLSTAKIFFAILAELKRVQPDVIHTHRQKENVLGSIANTLSVRARCIRTVHGAPEYEYQSIPQRVQNFIDTFCGKYLQDAIVCVSEELQAALRSVFPVGKLTTILNGIDPDEVARDAAQAETSVRNPSAINIGIIGRLEPVKRIDIFIQAAAQIKAANPQQAYQFHVFGDGSLTNKMTSLAQSTGVVDSIRFHGHRQDIRSCIHQMDFVIMCSDHEGLPMTALECLALNVPILCHSVGGLTQLLTDNPRLLVNNNEPNQYQQKIEEFSREPIQLAPFPLHYHLSNTTAKMVDIYRA